MEEEQDRLITRAEAAHLLAMRPQTLARWAMDGRHLQVVRIGRSARYRRADVLALVNNGASGANQAL
ncbi:MAG: helix-turn-helix domain-containing protein [Thermoguttaceae bacterium]